MCVECGYCASFVFCFCIIGAYNDSVNLCCILVCTMLKISIILLNTHARMRVRAHTHTHTYTHIQTQFPWKLDPGPFRLVICPRQLKMVSAAMQRWEINHLYNK